MSINPEEHWNEQKIKLKIQFPELTDADLAFDESKKNEMLNYLSTKLGWSVMNLKLIIETL